MAWINLSPYFLEPSAVWTFWFIVAFILFYLIRPKTRKVILPSLMFLMKDQDKSNINSFLQRFLNDVLFFIQLLVLLLLCATVAKPYIMVPGESYANNVVIVIDSSASMQAIEDGKTRFAKAQEIALTRVEGKNTIIVAGDKPELIVDNANQADTKKAIERLKPKETATSLYDAIVLGEQFLSGEESAVLVISDFASERLENEVIRAKSYLNTKGIDVYLEDVSKNTARNVGIIDLDIKDLESKVWIKNFNKMPETVTVKIGSTTKTIIIAGQDIASFSFPTQAGLSTLEIVPERDDFPLDNKAYFSTPQDQSTNIMYIANTENKYLTTALSVMPRVKIQKNAPPIINFDEPDVIILGEVNKNILIPGDITRIKTFVREQGIPLVILAQEGLWSIPFGDDIFKLPPPIKPSAVNVQDIVQPNNQNSYLTPAEIVFGQTRLLYEIENNERLAGVSIIAKTQKANYPVIAIWPYGNGKVMYYGLFDEYADFKSDIYYPIFWKRALDLLQGGKTIGELNKKAGYIYVGGVGQIVKTPVGPKRGSTISMDYNGFYEFEDFIMAANLINEEEQRLNKDTRVIEASKIQKEIATAKTELKQKELSELFLYIIIGLLLLELFYLKFRGDI